MTGKRKNPGDTEEFSPLANVQLSEEYAQKLEEFGKIQARAELLTEKQSIAVMTPVYEQRREILKGIDRFWGVALMNHALISLHTQHQHDIEALSFLEDVWIVRDPVEMRCFTLEFGFKENPYFTNKVLKKEFKYIPNADAAKEKPDENGISDAMLEFAFETNVKPSSMKIDWKSPDKALTTLYPRLLDAEGGDDEDDEADSGSFFNFFEHEKDITDLGTTIAHEIFPEAIEYFLGTAGDTIDSDDEDSDEDSDNDEEIDLEKPRTKKQKV